MRLSSTAFDDGATIPEEYGYAERNVNPPLTVADAPADAESLALAMDDPDAVEPAGKVWDHWIVWNVPADATDLPADWDPTSAGAVEGQNDYGETGYGGPNPPDREHTYRFVAYALDTDLDLSSGASKADLEDVATGHVVESATLEGTYAP